MGLAAACPGLWASGCGRIRGGRAVRIAGDELRLELVHREGGDERALCEEVVD